MTQDRVPPTPTQAVPLRNQRSIDFIEALLDKLSARAWVAASTAPKRIEAGGFYTPERISLMPDDQRHHMSAALYRVGAPSNEKKHILAVPFVVIDDVGRMGPGRTTLITSPNAKVDEEAFILMPEPSWRIETSPGNFQFGYCFDPPLTLPEAEKVHAALKASPDFAPGLHAVGQYFRLPSGRNTKPDRGDFETRLVSLGGTYTLETWETAAVPLSFSAKTSSRIALPKTGETCSQPTLRKILDLLPNTDPVIHIFDIKRGALPSSMRDYMDRETWVGIAHAIRNSLPDDPLAARDEWLNWNARPGQRDQTPGEPERVWDELPPDSINDVGTLRIHIGNIHGPDSDEYRIAGELTAQEAVQGVFDTVDDDELAAVLPKPKAEKEFDKLLDEIRKLQPTPARHVELPDTQLDDVFDLMAQTQVDAPLIIAPYLRGRLSTIAGPPGKGKSLLLAQQCLAIALEKPDLIRRGAERLQLPGDVLYFCNEDGKRIFTQRAAAWAKRFGVNPAGRRFKVIPVVSNLLRKEGDTIVIECIKLLQEVLNHIKSGRQIAAIAIDTVPASTEGIEENSAKEMGYVHRLLTRFASSFWAAVIMVTHTTKASWDDGDGRSMGSVRGSGATVGTSRGVVTLSDLTKAEGELYPAGTIIEWVVKSAAGRQGYEACAYTLEVVNIDVEDAEVVGKVISKGQPVLVPVVAKVTAFVNEDELDRLRGDLDALLDHGLPIWVAKRTSTSGDQNALHNRWQKSPVETEKIITNMEKRGWFSIKDEAWNSHLRQNIRRIVR